MNCGGNRGLLQIQEFILIFTLRQEASALLSYVDMYKICLLMSFKINSYTFFINSFTHFIFS